MLQDAILKIKELEHREQTIQATLEINKNSKIFIGHFPDQSVLPGVCMLQIVKEVLQSTLNPSFRLKRADYIKFIRLINPEVQNSLQLTLKYKLTDVNNADVTVNITAQNDICFKFKGSFIAG